jgi:hypothetical protein
MSIYRVQRWRMGTKKTRETYRDRRDFLRATAQSHAHAVSQLSDMEHALRTTDKNAGKAERVKKVVQQKRAVQQSAKDLQGAYDDYLAAHKEHYAGRLERTSQRESVKKSAYRVPSAVHEVASLSKDDRYQVAVSHLPEHWAGEMEAFKEETAQKPLTVRQLPRAQLPTQPSAKPAPVRIPLARTPAHPVHPEIHYKGLPPPGAVRVR